MDQSPPPAALSRRNLMASGIATGIASLLAPAIARAEDGKPITCSISLQDNRVWIAASIKGSKPMLFIVDTGAEFNLLSPAIAAELKLPVVGVRNSAGLGKNIETGELVTARDFLLGGTLRIPQVAFTTSDIGHFHNDAAGLLAAGLFTAYDTDIDFEHSQLRIWPKGRPNRDGLIDLPSRIMGGNGNPAARKVVVTAMLDGRPYRLMCDTGAPGGVLLHPNAAYASAAFSSSRSYAIESTAGIGGLASRHSRVVRMQTLQIGPVTIGRPLVTVMDPGANEHSTYYDGLLGLDVLQCFLLSTDARNNKLWVARNNLPVAQPHYRLSGVWLDHAGDGAVVNDVGGGSPAAVAGLRAGDVIVEPKGFEPALRAINGGEGKAVALKVRRGGEAHDITYSLRPWL